MLDFCWAEYDKGCKGVGSCNTFQERMAFGSLENKVP